MNGYVLCMKSRKRKSEIYLFRVDRRFTKNRWWSYVAYEAFVYRSLEAAKKDASILRGVKVITKDECDSLSKFNSEIISDMQDREAWYSCEDGWDGHKNY